MALAFQTPQKKSKTAAEPSAAPAPPTVPDAIRNAEEKHSDRSAIKQAAKPQPVAGSNRRRPRVCDRGRRGMTRGWGGGRSPTARRRASQQSRSRRPPDPSSVSRQNRTVLWATLTNGRLAHSPRNRLGTQFLATTAAATQVDPLAAIVARFAKDGGLPRYYRGWASTLVVSGPARRSLLVAARADCAPRRGLFSEYSPRVVTSLAAPSASGRSDGLPGGFSARRECAPLQGAPQQSFRPWNPWSIP
jgi:hypothetical protein